MQTETARAAPWARPRAGVPAAAASNTATREHAVWLAVIVGVALALRLAWVAFTNWHPLPDDDAFRYDFAARALVEGRGYIHLNGQPTAFWPPGYPFLLAAVYAVFGESLRAAQLLNVVLGTATVVLVYLIGRRTLGARPALTGAAIVACFPSLVFFTGVTLSEVAFTFFALLGIYLLLVETQNERTAPSGSGRNLRLLVAAGLALGFASLIRGQALLLPIVLIPYWLRSGTGWSGIGHRLVALALGIGLIVAPWTVRNVIQLDSPVLISTNAGVDFWIGHNPTAGGTLDLAAGNELVFSHPELTGVEREVRVNRDGFQKGLTYAATHPLRELTLPLKKLSWLYYNDEEGLKWNEGHGGQLFLSGAAREGLTVLSNVYYFGVLGLLLLGAPLWFSLRDPGRLLLVLIVAYWTGMHLVFFGDPRFHAPIMPVIALLAALGWTALRSGRAPWQRPASD